MVYNAVLPLCIQTLTLEPLCFVGNVPYSLAILGEVGELGEGTPRKGQKPGIWANICKVSGVGGTGQATFAKSSKMFEMCLNAPKININNKNKRRKP